MPLKSFRTLPKDMVEWGRFFESQEIVPDDESVGEDQLIDGEVTYQKIQNVTPDRILGRDTSPAGTVQELIVTGGLEFTGSGIQRSALTGDITAAAGSNVTALRDGAALSVIGRASNSIGATADVVATVAETFLVRRGSALTWDALADGDIPASIARDAEVTSAIASALTNITSGTYTPTLSNITHVGGSTAYSCQYLRIGSVVTVSGRVDVNPTSTGLTVLNISLPVASNFANANECGGTAFSHVVASLGAAILADAATDTAQMSYDTTDTSDRAMFFTFTYRII